MDVDLGREGPAFSYFRVRRKLIPSDQHEDVVTEEILDEALSVVTDGIDGDYRCGIGANLHRLSVHRSVVETHEMYANGDRRTLRVQ